MRTFIATLLLFASICAFATPSTTYWTPCTLDFQPANLTHITYDTYTRVSDPAKDAVPSLPIDYGLTWGSAFKGGLAVEYGFDYFAATKDPMFFNAKIGYPENSLGKSAPAVAVGIFNVGTKTNVTNQDVVYAIIGKSLPKNMGRLSAAYYVGNSKALGGTDHSGYMVAYDKTLIPDKVVLAADYASGDNAIGGGGVGLYYYFTKNIAILAGPVWFNDKAINGKMKLTMQVDINF